MFNHSKKILRRFDWLLFFVTVALCGFGFVVLHSALTSMGLGIRAMRSQIIATAAGLIAVVLIQFLDIDYLKKLAAPVYVVICGLLLATLIMGFGEAQWGARSWLKVGPVIFQPSEFAKLGLMLSLAFLLEKFHNRINHITTILILAISMGFPVFMILRQPDFGTAAVLVFFIALMIFYAGIHWGYIVAALVLVIIAVPVFYSRLTEVQQNRILNFLNPSRDSQGSNYQQQQGLIAIGSGQLSGKGYMQGTQTQYGFIPERETDYIFSVLVEEFGFLGGLLLLAGYLVILLRILRIARKTPSVFASTLCVGIAAMLFIHIFENAGMLMGLMPVTGIPLPFLSQGGTFQLLNLICIGLVLSIGTQRPPLDFNVEK